MDINIGKANTALAVNVETLAPHVIEYVIRYGLTQILNDAHSSVTRDAEPNDDARVIKCLELAEKKLAAMVAGDVRATATRTGDPIKAECLAEATKIVHAAIRAKGKKLKQYTADEIRAMAVAYVDGHPEMAEAARARVAARRDAATDFAV